MKGVCSPALFFHRGIERGGDSNLQKTYGAVPTTEKALHCLHALTAPMTLRRAYHRGHLKVKSECETTKESWT